ncbi:MAG: hypothetical protein Q9160_004969 [Pyrenula sp. 1 TL-2023]
MNSLRLASRTMERKASQGTFASSFEKKDIKLNVETLQNMVRVTSQGWLGPLLRHCTITSIIHPKYGAGDNASECLHLLIKAFDNLKHRSKSGSLVSLHLRVATPTGGANDGFNGTDVVCSWQTIWEAALHVFNTTMLALYESQLLVSKHLSVFGNVRGCSLACDAFLASIHTPASAQIFRHLKELTVSLSASYGSGAEDQVGPTAAGVGAQIQSTYSSLILKSILRLGHIMPDLEKIDLHWYNIGQFTANAPIQAAASQECSDGMTFANLRVCGLHGLYTSESDLLHFFQTVRPAAVSMRGIYLLSGTWASIFKYFARADSAVTSYDLDDVHEGTQLVHFDVPGTSNFSYLGGNVGPSTLKRQTTQIKDIIGYRFPPGRALSSGKVMRYIRKKRDEFGPPCRTTFFHG